LFLTSRRRFRSRGALASAAAMIAVRLGQNSIASSQEGQPAGAEPDSINR